MGQVPLVTPTSQIVGIQAVNNVLFDTPEERYKMISAQSKDLFFGLYGCTPVPVNPEIQKKALKGYPRGETPITGRPAEYLEPEMPKNFEDTKGLAKDIDDVILYGMYPMTGKRFLNWKYGNEPVPPEVLPKTLEDCAREAELVKKAKAGLLVEKPQKEVPPKGPLPASSMFLSMAIIFGRCRGCGGYSSYLWSLARLHPPLARHRHRPRYRHDPPPRSAARLPRARADCRRLQARSTHARHGRFATK